MGNGNIFVIIIGAVLAYLFLKSKDSGAESDDSGAASGNTLSVCSRGPSYTPSFFDKLFVPTCGPGYEVNSFWATGSDLKCQCKSASIPDPAYESVYQEPVPRREHLYEICPYDESLLAGDNRCTRERMEEIETLTDYGFSVDGLTGSYDPATGKYVYIGN